MNQPRSQVVVVCSADGPYARPLAVTLVSLLAHLERGRQVAIHIIDRLIPEAQKALLVRSLGGRPVTISWHHPDRARLVGVPLWGRMPISVYDKLLIADLLPAGVEQALWLDSDTLVLNDVAPLWDRGTEGHVVLAVQDSIVPLVSSSHGVARYRDLGLRPDAKYFNAGVMLMDIARWRGQCVTERALEYLKSYAGEVSFWDQEGLNAVLSDDWGELDPIWNWTASVGRVESARRENAAAKIVHFNGNLKPWRYDAGQPYYQLYYQYVDTTEFAGWRPQPNWRSSLMRLYENSPLRRVLYPTERLATDLLRSWTKRVATSDDVRNSA